MDIQNLPVRLVVYADLEGLEVVNKERISDRVVTDDVVQPLRVILGKRLRDGMVYGDHVSGFQRGDPRRIDGSANEQRGWIVGVVAPKSVMVEEDVIGVPRDPAVIIRCWNLEVVGVGLARGGIAWQDHLPVRDVSTNNARSPVRDWKDAALVGSRPILAPPVIEPDTVCELVRDSARFGNVRPGTASSDEGEADDVLPVVQMCRDVCIEGHHAHEDLSVVIAVVVTDLVQEVVR